MDHIKKAGMKKKRKKQMFCEICLKFNHVTKDCYKNNPNLPLLVAENNNDILGMDRDAEANNGQIGQV